MHATIEKKKRTPKRLEPYTLWIQERFRQGYTTAWLARMCGVSQSAMYHYCNRLVQEDSSLKTRTLRYRQPPETPVTNDAFHDLSFVAWLPVTADYPLNPSRLKSFTNIEDNRNVMRTTEYTLNEFTLTRPTGWDDISYRQLAELWNVAQRATSPRGFLFYAAEVLYNISIRELPKAKNPDDDYISGRYLVTQLGVEKLPAVQASLEELTLLLDSVKWLLNAEGTQIESQRMRIPMELPPSADIFPPAPFLADLTLEEFLTAEDLRTAGAPLTKFLAVLYAPHTSRATLRLPYAERDFEGIEAQIRTALYALPGSINTQAWWWWWEGNLRSLARSFPDLFSNTLNSPDKPAMTTRPSDIMYMLSNGDFNAFNAIKTTNLFEALRLIQERIRSIGEGR